MNAGKAHCIRTKTYKNTTENILSPVVSAKKGGVLQAMNSSLLRGYVLNY